MSKSSDDFEITEFGSDIPTGQEAETLVQAKVQEFYERSGQPETNIEDSQDKLTHGSRDSIQTQEEALSKAVGDSEQCAKQRERVKSSECKNSTTANTELACPWDSEQYEADKTKFMRTLVLNGKSGYPTRLSEGVKSVYGEDYSITEYQRLRRLVNRCSWFRKVDKGGKFVQVEPEPVCFKMYSLLRQQYEYPQKTGRNGDRQATVEDTEQSASGGPSDTPKERVQSFCESYKTVEADSLKCDLLSEFVTWRQNIAGTYNLFQQYRDRARADKEYLLIELSSRFKDGQEATKSLRRLETALDKATESHSQGAMVTLTPDPKRFESHTEILEAVQDSLTNFIETFAYRLGSRPEYIKVLEFQKNGLPHYHIPLFGIERVEDGESETQEPTIAEAEVREYWDETRDVGKEIEVQPIHVRNGSWLLHEDEQGKVSLSYYLSEAMRGLCELADMDESELWDMVEAEDTRLWRQVLYWITEKQYMSCSNELKGQTENTGQPDIKRWDYVGTAEFGQIPRHVRENAIISRDRSTSPES